MARLFIDSARSLITFRGRSSVHPITATARPSGWFVGITEGIFDNTGPLAGHLEVPVADLASGNPLIDRETRRRIDARRHPNITGDLAEGGDVHPTHATVEGNIEFTGETVLVEGDLRLGRNGDGDLIMSGDGTFDVRWWGMDPPRMLMLRVEPEIEVSIRVLLVDEER